MESSRVWLSPATLHKPCAFPEPPGFLVPRQHSVSGNWKEAALPLTSPVPVCVTRLFL